MQKLIDKFLLFGLCLVALSLKDIQWISIAVMLGAVAAGSLNGYFENRISAYLSFAYVALCFVVPELCVFLPLIAYDLAGMKKWAFRFCWCAALPVCVAAEGWRIAAVAALASVAAFLLQHRTSAETKTQNDFYELADNAKEQTVLLENRGRELLEKQEYEVRLATLAERNRIAREIHDNVGHLLTRSILQLGALRVTMAGGGKTTEEIDLVKNTLTEAMDSIRDSVHNLHEESIDLRMRLETMIGGFTFCAIRLRYDAGELPVGLRLCFTAIAREALNNIARHSDATDASVAVTEHPAFYQLIVKDNGTRKPDDTEKGIGIQNMAERVGALGGVFRAEYNGGFRIFISVPKEGN